MKRKIICVLVLVLSFFLSACSSVNTGVQSNDAANGKVRTVVDMKGISVEVPEQTERYIVLWKSYTGVLGMLDRCEGLVGCDYKVDSANDAWLFEICPKAAELTVVTEEITAEEVMEMNVDVVFWQSPNCEELAKQLNKLGVPAVNVDYTDYETMKQSITLAAEVLGTNEAKTRAEAYNEYLTEVITEISEKAPSNREEQVSILNLRKLETLRADGKNTVADTWINTIGAVNIVGEQNLEGNQYLELEQIYEWDPDVIVSSQVGDDKIMYADQMYSQLNAVSNNNVFINPLGIFTWNRYCIESPLQLYWASTTFYPELFEDINIEEETKGFYKKFFDYEVSDEDIRHILNAEPPTNFKVAQHN